MKKFGYILITALFTSVSFSVPNTHAAMAQPALSPQVISVKVAGEDQADVIIQTSQAVEELPTYSVIENRVEFVIPGVELDDAMGGKVESASPHAMVSRLAVSPEGKNVRVRVELNGGTEDLKSRVSLVRETAGLRLKVRPPTVKSPTLELLKEEQNPFAEPVVKSNKSDGIDLFQWLGLTFVVALAAVGAIFLYRFMKTRAAKQGNRKFLIESLAFHSFGPKTGISLVKIGNEFVLLGVTPHQVTFLSALPQLAAQYQEESRFERNQFKDAVEEEVSKLQKQIGL